MTLTITFLICQEFEIVIILVQTVINTKGTECPRDRRDISRDRWDVSPGQTGGVPPKFFMFIGFSSLKI